VQIENIIVSEQLFDDFDPQLQQIGLIWGVDVGAIRKQTGRDIFTIADHLYRLYNIPDILEFSLVTAHEFYDEVEKQHNSVPFHSSMHGADVCVAMMFLIRHSPLLELASVLELNAALIAALAHSINHDGFTPSHRLVEENK
jgi:hypothetical protein